MEEYGWNSNFLAMRAAPTESCRLSLTGNATENSIIKPSAELIQRLFIRRLFSCLTLAPPTPKRDRSSTTKDAPRAEMPGNFSDVNTLN